MSRGPARQDQTVLGLLQARLGSVVSRAELHAALYPRGTDEPATALRACDFIVTKLRQAGHVIYCMPGEGYWMGAPPALQDSVRPFRPEREAVPVQKRGSRVHWRPQELQPGYLPPQQRRVLELLRARGRVVVSAVELYRAMRPGASELPENWGGLVSAAVSRLRRRGFGIIGIRRRGYRLAASETAEIQSVRRAA